MTTGDTIRYAVDTFRLLCGCVGLLVIMAVIYVATDR